MYWKGQGGGYWGSSAHVNQMREEAQRSAGIATPAWVAETLALAAKRRASALKGAETRKCRAAERAAAAAPANAGVAEAQCAYDAADTFYAGVAEAQRAYIAADLNYATNKEQT